MNPIHSVSIWQTPPRDVSRLFLVRHGSTEANERHPFVLQGCEMDGSLTELGRRQAASLAWFLEATRFSAVYSSPMQRAVETASIVSAHRDCEIVPVPALRECSVGQWEGLSWDQIRERSPVECERFLADPANEPHPGGESYRDLLSRVGPAIDDLLDRHRGENVLVVAHNMVNRVYLAGLLGVELRHARRIRQMNCCVNVIQRDSKVTDAITINSVWHLDDL